MLKIIFSIVLIILSTQSNFAQQIHRCYTSEYTDYLDAKHNGFKQNVNQIFKQAKALSQLKSMKGINASTDTVYRIPVVFHVVYNKEAENSSDAILKSQIRVLNEDYRRTNADTINTRAIFKARAADIGFEFFLATIDPEGKPTTGITRTYTSKTTFSAGFFPNLDDLDKVKKTNTGGKDAWNTDEYLNIWICNTGGAILGYAYPPSAAPNWDASAIQQDASLWGVVISHEVIGYENPLASGQLSIANKGRTTVHEVGHYFGLRHIWGDAGFFMPDCDITKDDGIDDTPHMGSNSQNEGCDTTKNTCTNGEFPDEPDMPENYMDYSTESCQNMFTKGQSDIMRSMIVIGRPELAQTVINQIFILNIGDYIVINGTDTTLVTETTSISLNQGDSIMFLNQNDGIHYVSTGTFTIDINAQINVTENAEVAVAKDISSINEAIFSNENISIYPNPVSDKFHIKVKNQLKVDKVTLTDLTGKTIVKYTNSNEAISTKNLAGGLYLVSIYSQNKLVAIEKISLVK